MKKNKKSKRFMYATAIFVLIIAVIALRNIQTSDSSREMHDPETIKIATGTPSSLYYSYGSAVCNVMHGIYNHTSFTSLQTTSERENADMLNNGSADFAFLSNDIMNYAYNGTDMYAEYGRKRKIAAVAICYYEPCHIFVRPGIASVSELVGTKIAIGESGSNTEINARQILKSYGISYDDVEIMNYSVADSARALKTGEIDACFVTDGTPVVPMIDLAKMGECTLLSIDRNHIDSLIKTYPLYEEYKISGGTYSGINDDVITVSVKASLAAGDNVPSDFVYKLTKSLFEKKRDIANINSNAGQLNPEDAVKGISIPLHPGAEKFYREIGIIPAE